MDRENRVFGIRPGIVGPDGAPLQSRWKPGQSVEDVLKAALAISPELRDVVVIALGPRDESGAVGYFCAWSESWEAEPHHTLGLVAHGLEDIHRQQGRVSGAGEDPEPEDPTG